MTTPVTRRAAAPGAPHGRDRDALRGRLPRRTRASLPSDALAADPRRVARRDGSTMILLPTSRPLYAAIDPVYLRRSFDVLVAIAREQLGLDALRSAIVLFFNRDRALRDPLLRRLGARHRLQASGLWARPEPRRRGAGRALCSHRAARARRALRGAHAPLSYNRNRRGISSRVPR